jgi:Na+/melibiose symporter-like transporter
MLVFISTGFIFIPFWSFIASKIGQRRAFFVSLVVSVIGWVLMAFPRKNQIVFALAASALTGMSGIFLTVYNFLYQVSVKESVWFFF